MFFTWVRGSVVPLSCVVHSGTTKPEVARPVFRPVIFMILFAALLAVSSSPRATEIRNSEFSTGADAAGNVWLIYTGTTLAPFGDIHQNGLRLRFVGAYGHYGYEAISRTFEPTHFAAKVHAGDALIGYLWRLDPIILKLFAGAGFSSHEIRPIDQNNYVQGPDVGIKLVVELWYNLGEQGFASLDVAWSQAHNTRSARSRIGYEVWPDLFVGPEAGLNLDRQADYKVYQEAMDYRTRPIDYGRIGTFARYAWDGGEVSASVGLVGDFRQEKAAYGTVSWIKQF